MRRRTLRLVFAAILVGIAVSLAGCKARPTPTFTPVPTVTPSPTPPPTPTPFPPQPPRVLSRFPDRGEELPPDVPIVFHFDQAMDPASAEGAVRVEPDVKGRISWEDAQTLRYSPPEGGFRRDTDYRVTLTNTVRSAYKLGLAQPLEFRVRTVGYLEVTDVSPIADAKDVKAGTAVRVAFNRPVVPLVSIQQQGALTSPLEITPPMQGKGAWVNTSIYTFEPSPGWLPGVKYTIRVRAGLRDTTAGVLAKDYSWSFTTESPDLVSVFPANKAQYVAPRTAVRLNFNQPMKQQPTQSLFSLRADKATTDVPGVLGWDKNTLVFTPTQALELGTLYNVRLEKGAPAATGEAAIAKVYAWQFEVARYPEVVSVRPQEGETGVDPNRGVQITFSSPISRETLTDGLVITPKVSFWTSWRDSDTSVTIGGAFLPSTAYTLTLTSKILGRYGHTLRGVRSVHFRIRPAEPSILVNLPGPVAVFSTYGNPAVYVSHLNVSRVDLSLYALSVAEFTTFNSSDGWQQFNEYVPAESSLVFRWSGASNAPLDATRTVSVTLARAGGQAMPSGIYYLMVSAPEVKQAVRRQIVLSDTNLTLKSSQGQAFVWATDMRAGAPVAEVALSIYDASGTAVGQAKTGADGVAIAQVPVQESWQPLMVLGKRGNSVAVATSQWTSGISPWDFRLNTEKYLSAYRGYLYTDRSIYRPGQKVYFKGIIRADNDGVYSLPAKGSKMAVLVRDDQGREIWKTTLGMSDMGTVDGAFDLSPEASLGFYEIQVTYQEQNLGTGFQVAEYRKPEFQVQVTLDKGDYLPGESIRAVAEASYFFGGPVADAVVNWRVMNMPYYFDRWHGEGYFDFSDYEYDDLDYQQRTAYGQFVTEGQGRTNAQGQFTFSVPADIATRKQSQVFTLEASVVDVNNQEVSARGAAIVHKGSFYTGLAMKRYVGVAGEPQTIQAITVDTQGVTRTQQSLEVICYRREWYSVREKSYDDNYYWTSKVRDTAVATYTVKTDNLGQAQVDFAPPEGGSYRIVARGLDEGKNEVRSATYLWVSGRAYINWRQENNDRIDLVADKKNYRPGETAQILIPSPYQGTVQALLTIERGHVMEHKLLQLKSNSELIQVPILPDYAPNVYVSIVIAKGTDATNPVPSFRVGYVMLSVSTAQKELAVTVTPDRTTPYKPRDQVIYDISAVDYQGRGVVAEVSLQLVDLAVESLTGPNTRNIVQEFYRERGIGTSTSTSLAVSADRRNLEQAAAGKGGGGGPGEGGTVRTEFPDTAFWAPVVRTDASGHARVTVQLPDNLTTWRMTAQAATAKTEVGRAQEDIVTSLDVMVRPVVPRFTVIGDKPLLGAVVHNNTAENLDMVVTLQAQGATITNTSQTLVVPARSRKTVSWPAVVGSGSAATLRFTTTGGKYSDAVELTLPVHHPSSPETVGTSGTVEKQTIELIRLPGNLDPTLGELTVELEPSLAAGMRDGLTYLQSYPYDCIEQTVSRFLPNVVTYRALRALGVSKPEIEAQLPQQVAVALQRIYALQNLDGGWGWWPNEVSSPVISAYVLLGLAEVQRADMAVDKGVLDRGAGFLQQWLEQETKDSPSQWDTRATVLYALAEAGRGDLGRTVALFDRRAGMSLYTKAYLAMTLRILQPEESLRIKTLLGELSEAAIVSATGAHWEEKQVDLWAMNTDLRSTAMILRAFVRLQPQHSLVPNGVRWLMAMRSGGRWETTQENVWSILALTDYMVSTGELLADYSYNAWLNGERKLNGVATPANVDAPVSLQVPIAGLRRAGDNDLVLERTIAKEQKGTGVLYYTAFLHYFLPIEGLAALNRGIIVDRQYYLAGDPQKAISNAKTNDVITVKLTMIAPNNLNYVVLEDPIPAGCEAVDTSLKTTSAAVQPPELQRKLDTKGQPQGRWDYVSYWAGHTELRDEKVVLFASYLPRGTYEYTYSVRCTTPGEYKVLPANASEMYFADVFGRSAGMTFSIAAGE